MGRALSQGLINTAAAAGRAAGGAVEGINSTVGQAIATSVNSVAQGVGQLTKTGIGAAKSAFETALPAVQNLVVQGPMGALGGLPGPAQFLKPLAGQMGKEMGEVFKQLQNPNLDVKNQLKATEKQLQNGMETVSDMSQQLQFDLQEANQKLSEMNQLLSKVMKQIHSLSGQMITNLKA